jgi:methenyltetrahydromethanopterin cyclohydrolase
VLGYNAAGIMQKREIKHQLNGRALDMAAHCAASADQLKITTRQLPCGGQILDFGIEAAGSLAAGIELARICMAGLGEVSLVPGDIDGVSWPHLFVTTDHPVAACLLSQYAGWPISVGDYFAMGSGPMRAAAAGEDLFDTLEYQERPGECVGVLESGSIPDKSVFDFVAERTGVAVDRTWLLVAPTSSQAGNLQVVARSVETCLHKLFELGFDVNRIASGCGTAPLSPVAADDLTGIGRTNDAILYGGRVTLYVHGDDESLAEIGAKVPAVASDAFGKPFLEIFEDAGRDFYQIDPHLFSPAEVVFHNLDTGRVHRFGRTAPHILRQSFGF